MDKKKIAVFFGGKSFEHDVSILTGLEAYFSIDTTIYEPIPVYIDINGTWWTGAADGAWWPNRPGAAPPYSSNRRRTAPPPRPGWACTPAESRG